jgi:uncharacterized protein YneF (UPF0154 family)
LIAVAIIALVLGLIVGFLGGMFYLTWAEKVLR